MKAPKSTVLILVGFLWVYYATLHEEIMQTRAISNAMQMESDLQAWLQLKVAGGRLSRRDMEEIFPEKGSLRFGGENRSRNFLQMVEFISRASAPPLWPGIIAILIGIWPESRMLRRPIGSCRVS